MRLTRSAAALAFGLLATGDTVAQDAVPEIRFRAEIHSPTAIRFTLSGAERPSDAAAYRLTDGRGGVLPIGDVLPNTATESLLIPGASLDPMRVHYLEIPDLGLRTLVRRDPIFRNLYSSKPLGAVVAPDRGATAFRIFSPRAHAVRLYLYDEADNGPDEAARVVDMVRDANGVWEATEAGDHHGIWYDFTVHGPNDPGNSFYETHPGIPRRHRRSRVAGRRWKTSLHTRYTSRTSPICFRSRTRKPGPLRLWPGRVWSTPTASPSGSTIWWIWASMWFI
jgi:hypothetical protein